MRKGLALAGIWLLPSGCAQLIGLDEYEEARLANGAASFDAYRFRAGSASFRVPAGSGLLANEGGDSRVVSTGQRFTRRGGSVELAPDGSFTYTPPGPPGVFWGDDVLEFSVQRGRLQDDAAEARLTVQPLALDMTAVPDNAGSGFALYGGRATLVGIVPSAMGSAGDFNGDGREDLVLGAPGPGLRGAGVYVALGKATGADTRLAFAPQEPGTLLIGAADGDRLGAFTAAGAGDVNGDGFDDVVAGAPGVIDLLADDGTLFNVVPDTLAGRAYVLFGRRSNVALSVEGLVEDATQGFYVEGGVDAFGLTAAGAGDVNGDGFGDLIVGAPWASPRERAFSGAAYVVFGGPDSSSFTVPGPDSPPEAFTRAFVIQGARETDRAGALVWAAGDVNGDGLDDVLVGAVASSEQRVDVGAVYVVFGKRDTNPVALLDFDLETTQGFKIVGADQDDALGNVAAVGDMNGDGLSDVAIGAGNATVGMPGSAGAPPGAAYVVFGKGTGGNVEIAAIEQGRGPGYAIIGAPPLRSAGLSMSAGDLDSDGLVDLLIGALPSPEQSKSYVVFGKPDTANVELAALEVGEPGGFSLFGPGAQASAGAVTGYGVISGCDLNADGIDDMVISGTPEEAPEFAGGAYAVFGWDMSGALGARRGALIGTFEDDTLELPAQPLIAARGGHGTDTLRFTGSGRLLDLRPAAPRFESIERIELSGAGANALVLDESALRRIPASRPGLPFELAKTLTVLSDGDDILYFDITGYRQAGAREGRLVYVRDGAFYGLEISPVLRVAWPPP